MIKVNKKIGVTNTLFNPGRYKTVYNQYQKGIYRELIAMMKRTLAASHIAGCVEGRDSGYQKEFTITPYSEDKKDKERVEWLMSVFSTMDIRDLFEDIHEAVKYKFSVIDFQWEMIKGRQTPVSHKFYDHKYFRYDPDTNYEILKIDFGNQLKDIPKDALICEYKKQPVMLPVLRDFILLEFGLEAWASFLENFGEPMIIGKYPAGCDPEIKKELEEGIENIAASSRGTMPQGTEIEIKEASKNSGDHEKFKEAAEKGISISLLGHENAVNQAKSQIGENLGPFKVSQRLSVKDCYFIDKNMQALVKMIFDRNFGDGRYPKFDTNKKPPLDTDKHAKVLDTAFSHGVKIPINEYRKLGIEVYEDQEFIQKPVNPFDSI